MLPKAAPIIVISPKSDEAHDIAGWLRGAGLGEISTVRTCDEAIFMLGRSGPDLVIIDEAISRCRRAAAVAAYPGRWRWGWPTSGPADRGATPSTPSPRAGRWRRRSSANPCWPMTWCCGSAPRCSVRTCLGAWTSRPTRPLRNWMPRGRCNRTAADRGPVANDPRAMRRRRGGVLSPRRSGRRRFLGRPAHRQRTVCPERLLISPATG